MPPHTTKKRTTNLKTKTKQNWKKIEPYGCPTTKELKKKPSSRPVGGVETGIRGGEDVARWWLADWVVPHMHVNNQKEQLGSETDHETHGSSVGK